MTHLMYVKQFSKIGKTRLLTAGLLALVSVAFGPSVNAQWVIPVGGDTINFDQTISGVNNGAYNGTAPANPPGAGQLDSAAWTFQLAPTFRGTATFGAGLGNGQVDGVYGFLGGQPGSLGTGRELGFVPPNGSSGSTFGMFSLLTTNGTGSAINQLTLQLDFNFFNGTSRGVVLNVSYTIGAVTTALGGLTFSPTNAPLTVAGTHLTSGLVNLGTTVANGSQITFNFTLATIGAGAGNVHDEVGIDNISLTEGFVPEPGTYAAGALALGLIGWSLLRRGRA